MARGPLLDQSRAKEKKERRIQNSLAHRLAKSLPRDVRTEFVRKYKRKTHNAVDNLLGGANGICAKCGGECGHPAERPSHQMVRMMFELDGSLGPSHQVQVNLFERAGVKNEAEFEALIASGRQFERIQNDVDDVEVREDAVEALRTLYVRHPEWRRGDLARLSSGAEEEETNGNGHPLPGMPG